MSDVLILGYYGFRNSGDDALLLSITEELRKQKEDIKITVLSKNPKETEKLYGVSAVKRDNIFSVLLKMISCKVFVLGGGTLIQDGTSTKSLLYYLYMLRLCLFFGKKVMLYANGIGPLADKNIKITKKILNKVDLITLRDKNSYDELEKIGVTKPRIILTADSAFCLEYTNCKKLFEEKTKAGVPADNGYFIVSVRDHKRLPCDFVKTMSDACDYIHDKYGLNAVFMPFQKSRDTEITNQIRNMMKSESYEWDSESEISLLLNFIKEARLVVGMRLHSLIYAALVKVPEIGLVYDPKVQGFMEYMGQNQFEDAEKLSFPNLKKRIDFCFDNREKIIEELSINLDRMKELSKKNAEYLIKLLTE